ncbi:MAG: methylenetetrahydrofolate--tRNA-(uracil(54)-C(5))-methyltransferase (FADH(2)-oxidizing) TrmFO [Anaerolineae bacterium]|nr:methylenetetrahydrofolate--tRNA-(uracil(54)-C(5))-methyltransferase (FADH(2)-oxidizing) TrmFO [Anaerolineae bacterium]MCB0206993.1 methylenetetrahydrofolate--tRNA-(uracil(54)-C(5))-methyltransferase (FADH(2)-oxidizing) TrmFO [Anaerolineae bacterium]
MSTKSGSTDVVVVGAGLAGTEAAWQLAQRGLRVSLWEMRPAVQTEAHVTDQFAELVCSNSLGATRVDRALGLLKEEMRRLGSMIIYCADRTALPAGGALAVDRQAFSQLVTETVSAHPNIHVIRGEITEIPDGLAILASGPLTSGALSQRIGELTGQTHLHFFDALAPIVTLESIAMPPAWRQSRYDRDSGESEGDYINCPLDREQYEAFVAAVRTAERIELRAFEQDAEAERFFEGCLPIEVLAGRGDKALAYGPMRPVGLRDPRTGRRPHAVVQLRQDNLAGTLYNLVGFQTNIRWPEQKRILRMIPGLEQAEFVRLGQMHRNTFINSPLLLAPSLQLRTRPDLFFAGQIIGSEGYVGSAAGGLLAGINAARLAAGLEPVVMPRESMLGALMHYVTSADSQYFQPMKANFGLLPPLEEHVRNKGDRYQAYASRGLAALAGAMASHAIEPVSDPDARLF